MEPRVPKTTEELFGRPPERLRPRILTSEELFASPTTAVPRPIVAPTAPAQTQPLPQGTPPRVLSTQELFAPRVAPARVPVTASTVADDWWADSTTRQGMLTNPNVRAFLDTVAFSEGTYGGERNISVDEGYSVGFNYTPIDNLAQHPGTAHSFIETTGRRNVTTAAGRYQFIGDTWESLRSRMALPDFGPESQDAAAIELARETGALPFILSGDIEGAIRQVNKDQTIWAGLPTSTADQPKRTWEDLRQNPSLYVQEVVANRDQNLMEVDAGPDNIGDPWTRGVQAMVMGGASILNLFDHYAEQIGPRIGGGIAGKASVGMIEWANEIEAAPATGKYARAPRNILEGIDPKRLYATAAEGLPLVFGLAAATLISPTTGVALMVGLEGGSTLDEMERYEQETGTKIDPAVKNVLPILVGGFNAALERIGLRKIMNVVKVPGLAGKLFQMTVAAGTESITETGQEINQVIAESMYDPETGASREEFLSGLSQGRFNVPPDIGERLIYSAYAGFAVGMAGAGAFSALGSIGRGPGPDVVYEGSETTETGEPIAPRFRIMKAGHPMEGKIVGLNEFPTDLQKPNFRRQLMRDQLLASVKNTSEVEVEASMLLVDAHASYLGMSTEEFIAKNIRGVVSERKVEKGDLMQQFGLEDLQEVREESDPEKRAANLGKIKKSAEAALAVLARSDDPGSTQMLVDLKEMMSPFSELADLVKGAETMITLRQVPVDTDTLYQEGRDDVGPIWYSQMQVALHQVGMPRAMAATDLLKQVQGFQKNGKFKAEELEWSGLVEYLEGRGTDKVSREEVFQFLNQGGVQVETDILTSGTEQNAGPIINRFKQQLDQWFEQEHSWNTAQRNSIWEAIQEAPHNASARQELINSGLHPSIIESYVSQFPSGLGEARWDSYTLEGGLNYKEILLRLPPTSQVSPADKAAFASNLGMAQVPLGYHSSHFTRENTLAHLRIKDRTDVNGKRVLFIEHFSGVPDAPFKNTWVELALKRILRYAAENGYDKIAWTRGEAIQSKVGGDLEGQRTFYDKILPNRMRSVSKEEENEVRLNIPGYETTRFYGIDMTDKLVERVMGGQPLFQKLGKGAKGSINFGNDGRALIKAFSTADISTVVHELGHLFRRTMRPEELAKFEALIGVENGKWTRKNEEKFARLWERYLYEGKTKHKSLQFAFRQFSDWLAEVYMRLMGSDIDFTMDKKTRRLFDTIIKDVMPPNAGIETTRNWWEKFMDAFDVENRFKRIGQGQTGFHIKNYYSIQERHTTEGIALTRFVSKKLGRDQSRIAKAILIAEDRGQIKTLMRSGDQPMIDAVLAMREYFEKSLVELRNLGGLRKGFREELMDSIEEKIRQQEARVKPTKKTVENLQALREALREAKSLEFVHIPIRAWFESKIEVAPSTAILALKVLKKRRIPRIQDLIDAGLITEDDVSIGEIIKSYSQRKGKDIALLNVRNAALREGAARRKPKGNNTTGYSSPPLGSAIFAGMEVNAPVADWLDAMTRPDRLAALRNILNATKMMAFYNPLLLNSYNLIQAGLAAGIKGFNPIYWNRALHAMRTKNESYYRAEELGISSQPFKSPLEDLNLKFGRATEGPIIAQLRYILKGAKGPEKTIWNSMAFAPFRTLKTLYQLSWESAWYMDRLSRQALYEYQIDQGMAELEAAQFTAKVFGDYASVPARNRKFLNTFLFTPTYKIAMGKLFYDSIRAGGSVISGEGTQSAKQRAAILLRTAAIVVGYDIFMTALGWDRDQFGRRYTQTVAGTGEDGTGIGPKELVAVWGGPHDLFYKMALRVTDSFKPEVENGLLRWVQSNKWEIQPLFRVVTDIANNKGTGSEPITFITDNQEIKLWKRFKYGLSQLVPMLGALANLDPSQASRAIIEENELSPQGAALFEQEYGTWRGVITGEYALNPELFLRPVQFVYARDIEAIRVREQVQRMQLLLEQEAGARSVFDAIMRGANPEDVKERMDQVPARVRNILKRVNKIISRLEDEEYAYPIEEGAPPLDLVLPDDSVGVGQGVFQTEDLFPR